MPGKVCHVEDQPDASLDPGVKLAKDDAAFDLGVMMRRIVAATLFFLVSLAPAFATSTFDSAERIRATLIGKPIRGAILNDDFKTINNRFVERYDADGSFVGAYLDAEGGTYSGVYSIGPLNTLGDGICFDFKDDQPKQCYLVRVTGTVVELFTVEGKFVCVAAIERIAARELEGLKPKK
jgi:hypothetical protein